MPVADELGLPLQGIPLKDAPRPTITPSAPDCRKASCASSGEQMSPFTITGSETACFTLATKAQSAVPE